ncbi:MAG: hypothetical protein H0U73_03905 [Tatlockia sp.]|nr:hypothetical protein [Tatlockia sp.]
MAMTTKEIFTLYDYAVYCALKYSITVPVTLVGNILDLLTLGTTKRMINVDPIMQAIPFPREATRIKENEWYKGSNFFNKGFGGVLRATATAAIELPVDLISLVLASALTILHYIVAYTLGYVAEAVVDCVTSNMCGSTN